MTAAYRIDIPLSKVKLSLMFLGSLGFVALGIWFIAGPPQSSHVVFGNHILIFISGLLSVLFFGLTGVFLALKLFDTRPGLLITEAGITDNSSAVSAGFIAWKDVLGILEIEVVNQVFVGLEVAEISTYIDSQKSAFKRMLMQRNFNLYGSVLMISANGLKYNRRELKLLLEEKLEEFKALQAGL